MSARAYERDMLQRLAEAADAGIESRFIPSTMLFVFEEAGWIFRADDRSFITEAGLRSLKGDSKDG